MACPASPSARAVGRSCTGHILEDAGRQLDRQIALCPDGPRIECQRSLEQADGLVKAVTR
jgi:hypothetical protein